MKLEGHSEQISKWILAGPVAVRVSVNAVSPVDDPTEPCLELETVQYLDHLQELANAGNVEELEKHGEVYVRRSA